MSWQPRIIQGGKAPARPSAEDVARAVTEFREQTGAFILAFRKEHREVDDIELVLQLAEMTTHGAIATDRFNAGVFGTMMKNLYERLASEEPSR